MYKLAIVFMANYTTLGESEGVFKYCVCVFILDFGSIQCLYWSYGLVSVFVLKSISGRVQKNTIVNAHP